jgi:hypothetical protein
MVAFKNVKNHYVQRIVYLEAFLQQLANYQGHGCLLILQDLGFFATTCKLSRLRLLVDFQVF